MTNEESALLESGEKPVVVSGRFDRSGKIPFDRWVAMMRSTTGREWRYTFATRFRTPA